jgi:excisionase family DNA binding protein
MIEQSISNPLTAEEVALFLRIPKASVYELIRQNRLPHFRIGRLVRIPEEGLRAWIASGGAPLPDEEEQIIGASNQPRTSKPTR